MMKNFLKEKGMAVVWGALLVAFIIITLLESLP